LRRPGSSVPAAPLYYREGCHGSISRRIGARPRPAIAVGAGFRFADFPERREKAIM